MRLVPVLVGVAGVPNQVIVHISLEKTTVFIRMNIKQIIMWLNNKTAPDLLRVWNIRTAVAGVSYAVTIPIDLVPIGNSLAVVLGVEDS